MLSSCTQLFFHPGRYTDAAPSALGIEYRPLLLERDDDDPVEAWLLPAQAAESRPSSGCTVLYLHGNGGDNGSFLPYTAWLTLAGVNVLMVEYRGYGDAAGRPDLDSLHRDAVAAIRIATSDAPPAPEIDPDRVVLFGQSLGGSIWISALAAADVDRIRGLATEGAFAGYRRIARDRLAAGWLTWTLQTPLSWTIDDDYKPLDAIAEANRPVLVIHGDNDRVVPPSHGELLYAAAEEPKIHWRTDSSHVDAFASNHWRVAFVDWLDLVCAAR